MIGEIFRGLFLFLVFLFTLYALARDDYMLFKKNISLEKIFNIAFIEGVVFLFCARLFYVLFHFELKFLNPFVFLLFPYYPGISIVGGLTGTSIWLFFLIRNRKLPMYRIFDFFSLSFFSSFVAGWIIHLSQAVMAKSFIFADALIVSVSFLLFLVVAYYFFVRRLKNGICGYLVIVIFSFLTYLYSFMQRIEKKEDLFLLDDVAVIGLFILACFLLLKVEHLLPGIRIWSQK